MIRSLLTATICLLFVGSTSAQVLINEVDADTPGTDSAEFVELYDGGAGNTDLTGLVLVFFNGSDDLSYTPAFDLDGLSTDANGFFVICGDAANVANCDLELGPGTTDMIQNGADAVALFTGDAVDFPNDTPISTTNLIDALVYDTDESDDAALLVLLNAAQPQINENANGTKDDESMQRMPDGGDGARNTTAYVVAAPSPGEPNLRTIVEFELTGDTQDESAGMLTYNVTIQNPDATNATTVDVVLTGGSATNGTDISTYTTANLSFPAGSSVNQTFSFTITDDGDAESTEDLLFELQNIAGGTNAEVGTNSTFTFNISDNDSAPPAVYINEIDSDSPGTDAAEFIELYDGGAGSTDLSGMVVVLFNGSDDLSYLPVFDLDGQSTNVNGFFVICGDAAMVPNCDMEVGPGSTNQIQNGADAVAIYTGDGIDWPNDTAPTLTGLIDALAYDSNDSDDAGLLAALGLSAQYNEGDNGDLENHSVQRFPDGTGTIVAAISTPGTANTDALPVELASFDVLADGASAVLQWQTLSETNNLGFDIEIRSSDSPWQVLGFVEGLGTSSTGKIYSYKASDLESGSYGFRLKQVDLDGTFSYSPIVEVDIVMPGNFLLRDAYPNPFNASTTIELTVSTSQHVKVEVFNLVGQRVGVLFDSQTEPGQKLSLEFSAGNLTSGVYLYRATGENFNVTKQMVLLK